MDTENIVITENTVEVTAPVDDVATLLAELKRLQAENAKLKDAKPSNGIKVSEKGGISIYGLGRFPVTLHVGQWMRLFAMKDDILRFIEANKTDPRVVRAQAEHEVRKAK